MKRSIVFVVLASMLVGFSCNRAQPIPVAAPQDQAMHQDKQNYSEAIHYKIDDLAKHIHLLKEARSKVLANKQADFDSQVQQLDADFSAFQQAVQVLDAAPDSDFLAKRADVNRALNETEGLYVKIQKDFGIKIPA